MKRILLLAIGIMIFGCSNDEINCDAELQELINKRNEGFKNCGDGWACAEKIQADFDRKKEELLNNCN